MHQVTPALAMLHSLHRFIAYGAMVGGQSNIGGLAYTDLRDDTYQFSEPSFDYQVCPQGVAPKYHQAVLPMLCCQACSNLEASSP